MFIGISLALTQGTGGGWVLPLNSIIGAMGDSITAQIPSPANPNYLQRDTQGFGAWSAILAGDRVRFPPANAKGVVSNTSAQMLARINEVTALIAGLITLMAGTNDAANNVPLLTFIANMEAMIDAMRAVGQVVVLLVPPPRDDITGGLNSTQIALLKSYRDWIRARHRPSRGVYVVDAWNDLAVSADSATCKAGMLRDGIHPTATGSWWIGYRLAQLFMTLYPAREPWDVDGTSLCTNALLAGTTGTKPGGSTWTGQLATSWTGSSAALSGDQAIAVSKVTVDGIERQRFSISGTWAGTFGISVFQTISGWGTTYNIGDVMSMAMNYEVMQASPNVSNIFTGITYKSGTRIIDTINGAVQELPADQLWEGVARVYQLTMPADSTLLQPLFGITLQAGTHTLIVDFWHPHLIKH